MCQLHGADSVTKAIMHNSVLYLVWHEVRHAAALYADNLCAIVCTVVLSLLAGCALLLVYLLLRRVLAQQEVCKKNLLLSKQRLADMTSMTWPCQLSEVQSLHAVC